MKCLVAIDSFKGSLTSMQAGMAAREGILRAMPQAEVLVRPLADGGEGTVEALSEGMRGRIRTVTVTGPHGRPVAADYGILEDGRTAIMEMSAAAGITLVSGEERNPLYTTTYGVGEMIKDAISVGCRRFIIGIGGSATNDGGAGMLEALGVRFLDGNGQPVSRGASGLSDLKQISVSEMLPELRECTFRIACDVKNPLCGVSGCSAIYGPQKGADAPMIVRMDADLARYADLVAEVFPHADPNFPGAGAAGGMGFAFLAFLRGELVPGVELILKETAFETLAADVDLVITGEGRLDAQTVMGKAPAGVAAAAKRHGKPVLAFSGAVTRDATACHLCGIDAFFPILRSVTTLEEAMDVECARANLADAVEEAIRATRIFLS